MLKSRYPLSAILLLSVTLLVSLSVTAQTGGGGGGSSTGVASGAINSGTVGQIAYYPSTGTTLSGITQVPIANQSTNPSTALYVSSTSVFAGTPDGTPQKPYTTLGAALAAASGTGPYAIYMSPGTYSDTGPINGGTAQLSIYGNNSTWTVTGGTVTINGPATVYDLNTVGAITYAYTGATRSERHGGSYSGGNIIVNGFVHWYGVQIADAGGYTCTVNGTLAGDFITGGMQIKSGGSSAFIVLNNSNLQRASGYNFDMTSGGILILNGGYLTTAAGTYNIYLPTANTLASSHAVQGIIYVSGLGLSAGSLTYYAYDNLSIDPVGVLGYALYRSGSSSIHPTPTWYVGVGGNNVIYRCTVAGTLRVGQLTSVQGDCGTAVDTGLRAN